jgi:hypothetical protein
MHHVDLSHIYLPAEGASLTRAAGTNSNVPGRQGGKGLAHRTVDIDCPDYGATSGKQADLNYPYHSYSQSVKKET